MNKLIKLFAFLFLAWTISIMISTESKAQTKKSTFTVVATVSPVFYFIYEGDEGDGAVELQIHDLRHQFVSMSYDRLNDQAKGNDPKNPLIKLIQMPEISPLAFRQVESLEESKMAVDGITVLSVRLNKLREAARIIYQ
jgi:hypothetical protein